MNPSPGPACRRVLNRSQAISLDAYCPKYFSAIWMPSSYIF